MATQQRRTLNRANTAAQAAAPVVITSSFLETIKRDAHAPVLALTAAHDASDGRPAAARSHGGASELTVTRRQKIESMDSSKHYAEAARLATDSEAVHRDELLAEERKMKLQEEARPVLRAVREARVETMDEVQELNHRAAKARVLDTWGRQRGFKAAQEADERDRAVMFDALAAQRDRELLEAARVAEERRRMREAEGSRVLAHQLHERAVARELHAEAVELEGAQLRRQAELRVLAEQQARRDAEAAARKRREDLAAANAAAAVRRAEREAQERAADEAALQHMIEKAKAEEARMLAAEAEKKEKERVWKELLARQQRDIDRRGEEDERKARAAQEAVVYAQRARERSDLEKREALTKRVLEERAHQLELKKAAAAEEALREQALLLEAERRDYQAALREIESKKAKDDKRERYRTELTEQIRQREEARRRGQETVYQARLDVHREEIRRQRAIEEARQRKVEELRREGISETALKAARVA